LFKYIINPSAHSRKNIYLLLILTSLAAALTLNFKLQTSHSYYYSNTSEIDSSIFSSGVNGSNGIVVSASRYATNTGVEILKEGGNAIDAAVAVAFVLAVTYPQAGNIGGGGFMIIRTQDNIVTSIDFREKAPSSADKNMFLDKDGNFLPDKSQIGHLSAGVPGSVAGLLYALEEYGTMERDEVMKHAIEFAENGFEIEDSFAESLNANRELFSRFPSTKKIFTKTASKYQKGEKFIQSDLANTLKLIMIHGRDGFYDGITADLIEKEMKRGGGIITKQDLKNYRPVERNVISVRYKGFDIYSMAPPSSGGVALIQLLRLADYYPVPDTNNSSTYAAYIHYLAECMKRVYADRSEYLGDPDFYDVPLDDLTGIAYNRERMRQITDTATPSDEIKPGLSVFYKESDQTTHVSIIDNDGNMVSFTTTLNNTYGSYVIVDGAGFFLNDEMDDFASKPGEPNMFGLIGSEANSIQPDKRMLSSMTPTIILKNGYPFMIVGSPGGGRIITSVFQTIINVIDFKLPIDAAIDKPRFHHQWLPDEIQYEKGCFSAEIKNNLLKRGHQLKQVYDFGRVEGIVIDWGSHQYYGYSDRRGNGLAKGY
jgi:gamma-glutamyltranspeptidase/glutathione hydrolase